MTKQTGSDHAGAGDGRVLKTAYMGQGASTYDSVRFTTKQGLAFDKLEREQIEEAAAQLPADAQVLEVGCGTARFSEQFARSGKRVTASDASPDMLKIAAEKCADLPNIEFSLAESANLPLESDRFDFVFAVRVLNSLASTDYALQTVREMIRVTKPGGMVLLEFANADRPFAKKNNSVRLSFSQLRELAAAEGCKLVRESGVLVFSQTLLNRMPSGFLPAWVSAERLFAKFLWKFASRGYCVFRKGRAL